MPYKNQIGDNEINQFYKNYLSKVPESTELISGFVENAEAFLNMIIDIPDDKLDYAYDEGKWNIKEVIQHIIDTERVFMYRCFRIGRRDTTPLPGFDQDVFALNCGANRKSKEDLIEEFKATRKHSYIIAKSLTEEDLASFGVSSGSEVTARAIAFTTIGHCKYHMDILVERYKI